MVAVSNLVQLVGFVIWPMTVVGLVWLLLKSKVGSELLLGIAKRISHVKGPGFEFDLKTETAGQVKVDLETQFSEYRSAVRKRFDALNYQRDIITLRDRLVERVLLPLLKSDAEGLRCTIYVPDIIFTDALYRLTDYYPTGGESGKIYSIRFGIIGRQWRLLEDVYEPEVPTDPQLLMSRWGMTKAQAHAKSKDHSFLVVMLVHEGVEQGLVLVTSETEWPFADEKMDDVVAGSECIYLLAKQVASVNREVRGRGPALKLFDE